MLLVLNEQSASHMLLIGKEIDPPVIWVSRQSYP